MADYQLTATDDAVIRTVDRAWIPNDPGNRNRVEYEQWLADGGVPDPYTPPPPPEPDAGQRANSRLDAGIGAAASAMTALSTQPRADPLPTDPVTQEQLAALQAQVDILQHAMTSMLKAQAGINTPHPRLYSAKACENFHFLPTLPQFGGAFFYARFKARTEIDDVTFRIVNRAAFDLCVAKKYLPPRERQAESLAKWGCA